MVMKQLKAPLQYEKIPLDSIEGTDKKRAKNMSLTLKRIGSYLIREKGKLLLVLLMTTAASGLGLLGPYMVGMAIDRYMVTQQIDGLGILLIWLLLIYILHSLSIFLQNYWMIGISQNTVYDLRKDLQSKKLGGVRQRLDGHKKPL